MYVQVINLQAPLGKIGQLRQLINDEYLPALRARHGFQGAHLLEQVDYRDNAKLVIFWKDHASSEDTSNTGVLTGSEYSIAARIPGLRIQRQSYIVNVTAERAATTNA